jgi:hypothetical protein
MVKKYGDDVIDAWRGVMRSKLEPRLKACTAPMVGLTTYTSPAMR